MKPSIFNGYRALFLRHQANGLNVLSPKKHISHPLCTF